VRCRTLYGGARPSHWRSAVIVPMVSRARLANDAGKHESRERAFAGLPAPEAARRAADRRGYLAGVNSRGWRVRRALQSLFAGRIGKDAVRRAQLAQDLGHMGGLAVARSGRGRHRAVDHGRHGGQGPARSQAERPLALIAPGVRRTDKKMGGDTESCLAAHAGRSPGAAWPTLHSVVRRPTLSEKQARRTLARAAACVLPF
jgi:hypothetical protein